MPTYRERAVVLRKLDYGEADRIFTFLTRTHGKVGAIAKGVRRQESKLGPSLELYGHVDLLLAKGRGELDVVAQVQRLPGLRIPGDVEVMSHAALIAELAERVCEDRHPVDGVYELTVMALDELARETDPRRASAYFMMAALDLLGYAPQLAVCTSCEKPLPAKPAAFSAAAGGFLCDSCALPGMSRVPLAAIKVLRLMASGDIATYRRLKMDPMLLDAIEGVLTAQLEHHLDRRLKSLQFLHQMRIRN
ncbi:MAG TPA: DNA repair protein RecO [Candidatus Dormibacteraeota bacterium]|nr:DNA repair protein RecO [Candidatus Dormibacteraeota bacterium]